MLLHENENGYSSNKDNEPILSRIDSTSPTPYIALPIASDHVRDRCYIEFHSFENWPMFKKLSGTLQIRYSFPNFTSYLNYVQEQQETIHMCDSPKSLTS